MVNTVTFTATKIERLDKFIVQVMQSHSRTKINRLIMTGGVRVNGLIKKPSFTLEPGMTVDIDKIITTPSHPLEPINIPLEVCFEDPYLLIVNKPRNLATHPAQSLKEPSLVHALLARSHPLSSGSESFRPGIVHRLDKKTTGLIMIAKNDQVHHALAQQIQKKEADRRYIAFVKGKIKQERFRIDAPLARNPKNRLLMHVDPRGKPALTHFKVLEQTENQTLLAAKLSTGRTHQIRVHLATAGYPIIGDELYGKLTENIPPMQLHAIYLKFIHPVSNEIIEVTANAPEDFIGGTAINQHAIAKW